MFTAIVLQLLLLFTAIMFTLQHSYSNLKNVLIKLAKQVNIHYCLEWKSVYFSDMSGFWNNCINILKNISYCSFLYYPYAYLLASDFFHQCLYKYTSQSREWNLTVCTVYGNNRKTFQCSHYRKFKKKQKKQCGQMPGFQNSPDFKMSG